MRYTKDLYTIEIIYYLKRGGILKDSVGNKVSMVGGIFVFTDKNGHRHFNQNMDIDALNDWHTTEPDKSDEPFKITEVGLYKTRDSNKVFVSQIIDDKVYG